MPQADRSSSSPKMSEMIGRLGLWIAGSALIGSAALVLWNRRALKSLREASEHPVDVRPERDEGIY